MSGNGGWFAILSLNELLLLLALIFVVLAGALLIIGKKVEKAAQQIHLQELSKLWIKGDSGTIHISELSTLWRNNQIVAPAEEDLHLNHPRTIAFMERIGEWAWFTKFPQQKSVCAQLLKLLDQRKGNVPRW